MISWELFLALQSFGVQISKPLLLVLSTFQTDLKEPYLKPEGHGIPERSSEKKHGKLKTFTKVDAATLKCNTGPYILTKSDMIIAKILTIALCHCRLSFSEKFTKKYKFNFIS